MAHLVEASEVRGENEGDVTRTRKFKVAGIECSDGPVYKAALLLGHGKGTRITLVFDGARASETQVRDVERLLGEMGLKAVEVQREAHPKPCLTCSQMMFPDASNISVWWKKKHCCYHCSVTGGGEHSYRCSTVEGLRYQEKKEVYLSGEGFIPLEIAVTRPFLLPRQR